MASSSAPESTRSESAMYGDGAREDALETHREDAQAYIRSKPDAQRFLQDLVAAMLRDKPDDPVQYAAKYVKDLASKPAAASGSGSG